MLLAWFATLMTLFFAELPSSTSISLSPGAQPPLAPAKKHRKNKTGKQRQLM
jgi:hypothetical protein